MLLKIFTSFEIFINFDQYRHIFKFLPKSTFFGNFDQNQDFGKNLSQFDYPEDID